jgi:predicted SAM-dependent methyltransferase
MLTLDIGCGDAKKGTIGIDIRKTQCVDVIADARMLPFKDNSFDHVFSGNAIEHFSHIEVQNILMEWVRVLKRDGIFEIQCPDLQARALLFFIRPNWKDVINIYGSQDYPENYHKCGFSFYLLKEILESCGIIKIRRIFSGYKGIPFIPDSLHIKGKKS